MVLFGFFVAFALLPEHVVPYLIDGTPGFPMVTIPDTLEEPWTDMTVIKTHYDCRGYPMWREVSRIKERTGQNVKVVRTSKETFDAKHGGSTATVKPVVFFKSKKSRLLIASPRMLATTPSSASSVTSSPPGEAQEEVGPQELPQGRPLLEVGPDRVIDTPIISCPEGYSEDYNGKCRPVFPDSY
ncbi:uncharacterized protein LOC129005809 [Macrosteles quadrilineatus]|uniref:uncharacterized protein LOC129005809 n=1 Tax=Macrosteles quadrilineatus TaxID=74068 RepID=UPI0023E2CA1D|nr:uncharacterized protein LOC129005809 [Macrosteles quadrilineatus]XP_054290801.1 uncharacterized protein LOC129005809 [Macrosteles quadrilineatus]